MNNPFIKTDSLINILGLNDRTMRKPPSETDIAKACIITRLREYDKIVELLSSISQERLTHRGTDEVFLSTGDNTQAIKKLAKYEDIVEQIVNYRQTCDKIPMNSVQ